ncbi:MAG TPA: SBBP repeat-containing protein [Acidobacteriota bacterium]|nr:SBBP repeat-containing protein [Acidobacteriota bacterium]
MRLQTRHRGRCSFLVQLRAGPSVFPLFLASFLAASTLSFSQSNPYELRQSSLDRRSGLGLLTTADRATESRLRTAYQKLPLGFEANLGQAPSDVKFVSRGSGYNLLLTTTDIVVALARDQGGSRSDRRNQVRANEPAKRIETLNSRVESVLRLRLLGTTPSPVVAGLDELPSKVNYLLGSDPGQWHRDIPTYSKVRYRGIYPGVDLVFYGNQCALNYDFVVAPEIDPSTITFHFDGARQFKLDSNGDLILETNGGLVRQLKPQVYQDEGSTRKEISGRYVLKGDGQIGFRLKQYDKSKTLTIAPVLSYSSYFATAQGLVYSTYLGGTGNDSASAIAVDANGNVYLAGQTDSNNFPAAQGSPKGFSDVFITKLNPAASAIIYSTYIGGSGFDSPQKLAVDAAGNAYVAGQTTSPDFPTVNAQQPAMGTGGGVSRSTDGATNWTDINIGLADDTIYSLLIDPTRPSTIYAGTLRKGLFKSTNSGAFWSAINNGVTRASIYSLAIDPTNPTNLFAGSFGGLIYRSNDGGDSWASFYLPVNVQVHDLAIDRLNSSTIYAATHGAGVYKSVDYGSTWISVNSGLSNGAVHALAIHPKTTSTLYAATEGGVFRSTDRANSWTAVNTGLPNPVIGSALIFDPSRPTIFDPSSPTTLYLGTFYSGIFKSTNGASTWSAVSKGLSSGNIYALAIDRATPSTLYAGTDAGVFKSTDAAASWTLRNQGLNTINVAALVIDPQDPSKLYVSTLASTEDAFVLKLNSSGSTLFYSTYLGGARTETATGVAVDGSGNLYVTGYTDSSNFPTANAVQATYGGGTDAFVAKYNSSGSALTYSTYLGGSGTELGLGIAADAAGNAYVVGSTNSTNFPTVAALQAANAGSADAFVVKIGASGSSLIYSTYLGGARDDLAAAVALDAAGNAYLTGFTASSSFPVSNPLQPSKLGDVNAFVTKLNPAGSALPYSTYLGGNSSDIGAAIAVDSLGNAFVAGVTNSTNFPTRNPLQATKGGGIFKSTNGGTTWNVSGGGVSDPSIYSLNVDPTTATNVYAATFGGIFKSSDGGNSWKAANSGLTNTSVFALIIDPAIPSTLYAGTNGGGIYKSADGANSWNSANTGLTNLTISTLAIDAASTSTLYAGTFGGGVFRSTNSGATWSAINSGLPNLNIFSLAVARTAPTVILAGTLAGVFKSTNGGASWTGTSLNQTVFNSVTIDPTNSALVYVANEAGIFKSTDGGSNFIASNTGIPNSPGLSNPIAHAVIVDPTNSAILYAGTFSGVYKSSNAGTAWSATGLISDYSFTPALAVDPKNPTTIYAGTFGGSDVFVAKLNSAGSALVYSTYLGGMGRDRANGIAVDSAGNAYVAGDTSSTNFPLAGALQSTFGGASTDAFVAKIPAVVAPSCTLTCAASVAGSEKAGNLVSFSATAAPSNCTGAAAYQWDFGDATAGSMQQNPTHIYNKVGNYNWAVTVRISDSTPCSKTGTIQIFGDPPRRRP